MDGRATDVFNDAYNFSCRGSIDRTRVPRFPDYVDFGIWELQVVLNLRSQMGPEFPL